MLRVLLELIRIIVIFVFFYGILGSLLYNVYSKIGITIEKYGWLGYIAILLLFILLYRNKLQFSGWYTGKGREKLPKKVSIILVSISILLLVLPMILNFLS
ncbi:hypothetical protein KDN24_11630 [Bacillus sp. Bva_UNVM-123]|uniref:hypothetical protein n=1 Tax=Bacillus sp. Bva_UNVM-123 TaxID=2829798 RepID=UPI00391F9968